MATDDNAKLGLTEIRKVHPMIFGGPGVTASLLEASPMALVHAQAGRPFANGMSDIRATDPSILLLKQQHAQLQQRIAAQQQQLRQRQQLENRGSQPQFRLETPGARTIPGWAPTNAHREIRKAQARARMARFRESQTQEERDMEAAKNRDRVARKRSRQTKREREERNATERERLRKKRRNRTQEEIDGQRAQNRERMRAKRMKDKERQVAEFMVSINSASGWDTSNVPRQRPTPEKLEKLRMQSRLRMRRKRTRDRERQWLNEQSRGTDRQDEGKPNEKERDQGKGSHGQEMKRTNEKTGAQEECDRTQDNSKEWARPNAGLAQEGEGTKPREDEVKKEGEGETEAERLHGLLDLVLCQWDE